MYSGTVKKFDLFLADLRRKVPDLKASELRAGPETIKGFPCEMPWMTGLGMGLINIVDVRRRSDGKLEFQLADEQGRPYMDGTAWATADAFPDEWPQ